MAIEPICIPPGPPYSVSTFQLTAVLRILSLDSSKEYSLDWLKASTLPVPGSTTDAAEPTL